MLLYYMAYVLLSSLVGLILMESGQYGQDISMIGYPNGASLNYFVHLIVFLLGFCLSKEIVKVPKNLHIEYCSPRSYLSIACLVNFVMLLGIIYLIFIAGAYQIWSGEIGKGEFRSGLGQLGALTYMLLNFVIPSSIALISIKYTNLEKNSKLDKLLIFSAYSLAFIFGASWGFKSTAIQILLPGLCFIFWKIRFIKVVYIYIFMLLIFLCFSVIFDGGSIPTNLQRVLVRLTVIQGNVQWYIWDQFINGKLPNFNYSNFLWASLGDSFINKYFNYPPGSSDWINMHYSSFVTRMVGWNDGGVSAGHNVQGGVFSEAVLWLGYYYPILSALSGIFTGYMYGLLKKFYLTKQYVIASVLSSYFIFFVIGWVNSGGVSSLIHLAVLFGFVSTVIFLKVLTYYTFYIGDEPLVSIFWDRKLREVK